MAFPADGWLINRTSTHNTLYYIIFIFTFSEKKSKPRYLLIVKASLQLINTILVTLQPVCILLITPLKIIINIFGNVIYYAYLCSVVNKGHLTGQHLGASRLHRPVYFPFTIFPLLPNSNSEPAPIVNNFSLYYICFSQLLFLPLYSNWDIPRQLRKGIGSMVW